MDKAKLGFEEFIAAVDAKDREFVTELHNEFMAHGCKINVKEARSGYMVSYTLDKKTVANFVFRKSGLIARIYANHINGYMEFLETLPDDMAAKIQAAPVCKRLVDPNDCNPKCATGYDFSLRGERLQKCRVNAFMFPLCEQNNAFIKEFVCNELKACRRI